jgi:bifunctional UDP-N-acetylglucosamine pyrophosphorylase/glucosamine-1-phosphate N-acetyltransferase
MNYMEIKVYDLKGECFMALMGIVLAAGQGKRMKSKLYKVMHPICGKPMVGHVIDILEQIEVERKVVIVGVGAAMVQSYLGTRAEYSLQAEQLGTGHAVLQAKELLQEAEGTTIVICGDTPLIKAESLQRMLEVHLAQEASATILTAKAVNPEGYGRVVRDAGGEVLAIVEQKDCSEAEKTVKEINAATYIFDNRSLFKALSQVENKNAQQEYYLTDVIGIMQKAGQRVIGYCTDDGAEITGINDRFALSEAEGHMRNRINQMHMLNGVTIIDPANTYIDKAVVIGEDTVLLPGCSIRGNTTIGNDCIIGPHSELIDTRIGERVQVKQSVLIEAVVGNECSIGPFAYLRPGAKLGERVKIGDFVEIKNADLGDDTKVSHLSYVGDATIGKNVNFGCGAITVNYDGFNKQRTEVGDNAFVGSNSNLVAPIKVGKGAYVVAGSTITDDVMEEDMAIARQRQTNKPGYANKLRSKMQAKKNDALK